MRRNEAICCDLLDKLPRAGGLRLDWRGLVNLAADCPAYGTRTFGSADTATTAVTLLR